MSSIGRVRCAILGATGLVAQRFFQRLQYHPWIQPVAVIGSPSTAGSSYDECLWSLEEPRPINTDLIIDGLEDKEQLAQKLHKLGVRIVFSALPDKPAEKVEKFLASSGFVVISHAQVNRLEEEIPLIIPEVNTSDLSLLDVQNFYGDGKLVSCSNCMVVPLAISISPLSNIYDIESINISTEQSLSGGGRKMLSENLESESIDPEIPGESESVKEELKRILNADFIINANCKRVLRHHGHSARVIVHFNQSISAHKIISKWNEFTSRSQKLSLPSAPEKIIHFVDGSISDSHRWLGFENSKNPSKDLRAGMGVAISDVQVEERALSFTVFCDNTIRGAAGYGVLLAEQLLADGLVHDNDTVLTQTGNQ